MNALQKVKPGTLTNVGPSSKPTVHGSPRWYQETVERSQREGIIAEKVVMTPALANHILKDNPHNRQVSILKKGQLVRDIQAGRWVFNGEALLVSKEGLLNDGQHRAEACIAAQTNIETMIIFGLDRASRMTLDLGSKRRASDYLHMMEMPYSALSAAIGRLVIAYEETDGRNVDRSHRVSATQIVERFAFNEEILAAAHFAGSTVQKAIRGMLPGSAVGFAFYTLSRLDGDLALEYLTKVFKGAGVEIGEVAYTIRNMLLFNERLTRGERLQVLVRGWNALRQGKTLHNGLRDIGTELPRLY